MGRQDIQRDCYWYSALTGSDWDKTDDSVNTIKDTYSDEKIDHEEDIEGKIYLLSSVCSPGNTGLNFFTENKFLQKFGIHHVLKFCNSCTCNHWQFIMFQWQSFAYQLILIETDARKVVSFNHYYKLENFYSNTWFNAQVDGETFNCEWKFQIVVLWIQKNVVTWMHQWSR